MLTASSSHVSRSAAKMESWHYRNFIKRSKIKPEALGTKDANVRNVLIHKKTNQWQMGHLNKQKGRETSVHIHRRRAVSDGTVTDENPVVEPPRISFVILSLWKPKNVPWEAAFSSPPVFHCLALEGTLKCVCEHDNDEWVTHCKEKRFDEKLRPFSSL